MSTLTLYLHGQGITNETANAHCAWVRQTTGLAMVPLTYHDLVDNLGITILGRTVMAPTASAAELQLAHYRAELDPHDDSTGLQPAREITRAHLYETYRSALPYLTGEPFRTESHASLVQQIELALGSADPDSTTVTLVAHSLGSVIGLDLLHDLPPGITIHRFVTLGSPLGLITSLPGRAAATMIPLANRSLSIPWHDFAVEGDALATLQRLKRRRGFRGKPLTVTTIHGDYTNPHESFFIYDDVAKVWTTACR